MKKRLDCRHCAHILCRGWWLLALLWLRGIPRWSREQHPLTAREGHGRSSATTRLFPGTRRVSVKTSSHVMEREQNERLGRWNKREVAFMSPSRPPARRKRGSRRDTSPRVPGQRGSWQGSPQSPCPLRQVQRSPARLNPAAGRRSTSHPSPATTGCYSPTTTGSTRMAFRSRPLILARFRPCPACGYLRCG